MVLPWVCSGSSKSRVDHGTANATHRIVPKIVRSRSYMINYKKVNDKICFLCKAVLLLYRYHSIMPSSIIFQCSIDIILRATLL
mmetsp:Transcript_46648/g.113671  ORF Transcript_46648/g.113671 Transcript_46648/m.113671 type:complete len:84 (-) Transcript_46648:940-1191(-)